MKEDDGTGFVVMPFIDGDSLAKRLELARVRRDTTPKNSDPGSFWIHVTDQLPDTGSHSEGPGGRLPEGDGARSS